MSETRNEWTREAPKVLWEQVEVPREGDLALHVDGHDGRIVTKVEGSMIWLYLGGKDMGPFPGSNYIFKRRTDEGEQQA